MLQKYSEGHSLTYKYVELVAYVPSVCVFVCSYARVLVYSYTRVLICLCTYILVCLCICVFVISLGFQKSVHLFIYLFGLVNMSSFKKNQYNKISIASIAISLTTLNQILIKWLHIALFTSPIPLKNKVVVVIFKAIIRSFWLISLNSWSSQIKFLFLDKIWLAFNNIDSSQYLKSTTTYKKYVHLIKYLYGYFVLVV